MTQKIRNVSLHILLIGCGNMAGAMLERWLAAGLDPALVSIVDPGEPQAPAAIAHFADMAAFAASGRRADWVMLAVKPQQFRSVADTLAGQVGGDQLLLSIMAGVTLADLADALPGAGGYVRLMPALPVRVGKGVTLMVTSDSAADQRGTLTALLAPLGTLMPLTDEAQIDLFTAFTGSGPAFVLRLMDAYAAAGERLGLPSDQAQTLAQAIFDGAGALLASDTLTPSEWAIRVASRGGMTQAGLDALDADGRLVAMLTEMARSEGAR